MRLINLYLVCKIIIERILIAENNTHQFHDFDSSNILKFHPFFTHFAKLEKSSIKMEKEKPDKRLMFFGKTLEFFSPKGNN